jgi:hypothetical protein
MLSYQKYLYAFSVGACLLAFFAPVGLLAPASSLNTAFSSFLEKAKPELPPADKAKQLMKDGNYKDALETYLALCKDPLTPANLLPDFFTQAIQCLRSLARENEFDALAEELVQLHPQKWELIKTIAQSYLAQNYGFIVAGKFERGNMRGGNNGAKYVDSTQRDRVRALQLMQQSLDHFQGTPEEHAALLLEYANVVQFNRSYNLAWRLQELTDTTKLPDYDEAQQFGWRGRGRGGASATKGAPVDEAGNPLLYKIPASWKDAANDGERWRWLLEETAKVVPTKRAQIDYLWANFLQQQFGVQTMGNFYRPYRPLNDGENDTQVNIFAVHTLGDNETIAQLANGIKRFELPEEYNPIKVFQKIAAAGKSTYAEQSLERLATLFADRQQYPKSADYWKKLIAEYGNGPGQTRKDNLQQIIGNWGSFNGTSTQPAEQQATIGFRFRNAQKVSFTAKQINMNLLIDDMRNYLKSRPAQLNWGMMQIESIGYNIFEKERAKYIGQQVAQWQLELKPTKEHFDKNVEVQVPLQKAGVYLITAQVDGGNECHSLLWLDDTAIIKKDLNNGSYFYVADARTGAGIAQADVEFIGYQTKWENNKQVLMFRNFSDRTNAQGELTPSTKQLEQDYNWVAIARTKDGRLAFDGIDRVWYHQSDRELYDVNRVYVVTDRPVYRPDQKVEFKFWLRNARYDLPEDASAFANKKVFVEISDPQGEKVFTKEFTTDTWGGLVGDYTLPKNAKLGQYNLELRTLEFRDDKQHVFNISGSNTFRVEEYKKPEFEVTVDAPDKPILLGDTITAKINAKYYFGAPVTSAKIKYKIERSNHDSRWYPVEPWDWLYGNGYWWFGSDYDWYPGFGNWGCIRPVMTWWPNYRNDPPELIIEREVEIGPDGTFSVEIDTKLAQALHPDMDHAYTITAEVTDESRRTIVGSGKVLVARKPFQVNVWLNRGFYQTGDDIEANFKAQTLDQKPVTGPGKLSLFKINYDAQAKPVEKLVQEWDVATDAQGSARQKLKAGETGQYRLSYKVKDEAGHEIEGAYVFIIRGDQFASGDFTFNDIELIPEKKDYQPGEKVRLLINTNRRDSTVLLYVRPLNGVYPKPIILHIPGKSMVYELDVTAQDLPNFYLEAETISSARVHTELREIMVPPVSRAIKVEVKPSQDVYKPGQDAEIKLQLTDLDGKPFTGSMVMSVYDRSVEYISGGSNVSDILKFFWDYKRHHSPQSSNSLMRSFSNITRTGKKSMQFLGIFGHLAADVNASRERGMALSKSSPDMNFRSNLDAMPMAAAAPPGAMMETEIQAKQMVSDKAGGGGGTEPQFAETTVRTNFADTAYWNGLITTNDKGEASVTFKMPENLTDWKIRTWGLGNGTRVGENSTSVKTSKNLLVRLQAPRFFTETDEVVLSANVHNYLATEKTARVELVLDGGCLESMTPLVSDVKVAANGEVRVDWRVKVVKEGEAAITMKALTDEESDAMQMKFPVYVHGFLKTESYTGVIRPNQDKAEVTINIPAERRPEQTRLEIRYSPTLAGAMVDALPYMVEFPYGCTEQTLNRFLPTVITQNILQRMNLDLKAIRDKRANLNAQEIGDAQERAKGWKRFDHNAVFDTDEVAEMVKVNVQKLTEMQCADGGWGWFSGFGEHSSPHTTAVVVHGLQIAMENNISLVPGMIERGITWLENYQREQIELLKNGDLQRANKLGERIPYKLQADNLDAMIYMILVDAKKVSKEMGDYLYRDRTHLSVYALGMIGLAYHLENQAEKLQMIMQNIDQFLQQDEENQTAWLKLPAGYSWWYWHGNEIEANAYYLKLLSRVEPKGQKASRLVKYLLNNRKHATYWNSTRDSALCVEALAEFMVASGEDQPNLTVDIAIDGKVQKTITIKPEDLFVYDDRLIIEGEALTTGEHKVELIKRGNGPLYWNAYVTNFTLEDFITKAGLEVKVERKYYKLVKEEATASVAGGRGQAIKQQVEKYRRQELAVGDELKSGDLIEIELVIDTKNDYEYLIFEDRKAAGFEPVNLQSGYIAEGQGAYVEFRDERVVFFMRTLPHGKRSMSYKLRAEIPGKFSALPANASAMYAPELRGNSDEMKINITDR